MISYRNGAYEIVIDLGRDPVTGRRKRLSRSVRTPYRKRTPGKVLDVEAELRVLADKKLRAEVEAGGYGAPKWTVGELLDRWLDNSPKLAPTTRHGYSRCIRLYLKPTLGEIRVDRLTTERVDALYRALERRPVSEGGPLKPATVRQAHAVLRRALHQAQRWGWIDRNVAEMAEAPVVESREHSTPTAEQIRQVIDTAPEPLALLVTLTAGTGARRGEVCGLRWSDVRDGEIVIRRSVTEIAHQLDVKTPKSGKLRRVPIGPRLQTVLADRKHEQEMIAEKFGVTLGDAYVLSESPDGSTPLHPNLASDRFRRHTRALGMTVRLHDLRHAAATRLLAAGIPPNDVAEALGWASTKMLFDTYGHHTPAHREALAAAIDV